ncbi:MAG: 3-oxoacyl-ACP synthase [Hymenobacter sp.]|nr:MAG: 3-oxoacyl-ACP synthase [Hymenobacter sp.]
MNSSLKLLRSCSIADGTIQVNGTDVFAGPVDSFGAFARAAFRALGVEYPKFHKMDNLAKLGFLAAEHLLAGQGVQGSRTGIILANATSSLDTDLRHETQLRQGVASPALFVYTLPNIVVGELCIRHGIKGESLLFVTENYEATPQVAYVANLFTHQRIDKCLGGWIDFFDEDYRAFFYLVGPSSEPTLPDYTAANVEAIFTQ